MPKKEKSRYWGNARAGLCPPYVEYENTPLWRATKKALSNMEENQDLLLNEWHQYVLGYVCKQIAMKNLVKPEALQKPARKRPAI
jgi:hypothetical protein